MNHTQIIQELSGGTFSVIRMILPALKRFGYNLWLYCVLQFICVRFSFLGLVYVVVCVCVILLCLVVHGQVTIILCVCLSVCLSVCLFVCAEFFSAIFDPISIKLGHMLYVWV